MRSEARDHDRPVLEELARTGSIAGAARQVGDDDVGGGSDDRQVASEAGTEGQRPPERLRSGRPAPSRETIGIAVAV